MEGAGSALAFGPEASKAHGPKERLAGTGSESSAAEDLEDQGSSAFFPKRDLASALEMEDEESEGAPREQSLKEAYIQLVQGTQEWRDGCTYQGEFGLQMKLGFGEFSWPTGETYRGHFYRDHRHGLGTYTWPDGSSFTGMFSLSHREGYGTMYLKSRIFQGLYKADRRFGPGVETYPDGSQDVGLWFHEHLIKLCSETPGSFSLLSYPKLAHFLTHTPAKLSLSDDEKMEWGLDEGQDPFFYEYKRFLLNDDLTLPPDMHVYSTDNSHLPMTYSFRKDLDARLFMDDIPPFVEDGEPWFITNETPLMVRIQRQTYKFRNKKAYTSWNMAAIVQGDRRGFARCGPRERLAKEMILKAEDGDHDWIYKILRDNLVCADVADAKGYTALAAAAVHCHRQIINLLLDSGADVNKRSDEGLTPLSMCFLLYYPAESFKPNIAERTVPAPQGVAAKAPVLPSISFLPAEDAVESLYYREQALLSQSYQDLKPVVPGSEDDVAPQKLLQLSRESADVRSVSQRLGPAQGQSSRSQLLKGPDDALGTEDKGMQGSNTSFDSNLCVHSFSIQLSLNILERSAQAYTLLKAPCLGAGGSEKGTLGAGGSEKGTMRKMALSMIEHRKRWQTIQLLLRRGADPNLCRVPMQVLFFAVKAADVDGVKLLLENGARTDVQLPPQLRSLTPLHIAAALPGEEGVRITELLLHAITDVDAQAADQDEEYRPRKMDALSSSSLKLNNEPGPPSIYYTHRAPAPEGGRTALHVACEREDDNKCARDIVRLLLSHKANPNTLWSGHSPLSLSIVSGNDMIVRELLSHGADPNLPLTKGLGNALCMACDLTYEHQRSTDNKLSLIDRLINYGADILNPVTLIQGDKVAVGTAVDYGYFKFFQDRKIAHCPFHALMPSERETLLARKRVLEYMGFQLRRAVFAKESQWNQKLLYLSKRVELAPNHRLKKKCSAPARCLDTDESELIPFFKFCHQCGRSIGVRLSPCTRCYGILTCSKFCKTRAWNEFHKRDCGAALTMMRRLSKESWQPLNLHPSPFQRTQYSTYSQE
ncbi:ankyrin repeat and MYND domain-containing protein 1 isoform X2 [Elephas maximus indicus]|uniref:ankyrin repeat and MYND domain-containing protein 1 isoform X2 n=1 Tax=Elephas maximus indicus TaxID=99487 RepID=UPI002115D600|nr:ankyrin repeat and MYND domain-containing protein 1 isoform X2 [Elephas maximus indicus]